MDRMSTGGPDLDRVTAPVRFGLKLGGQDVTADAYPYLAWHSNLKVLVPNKQWTDAASVKEALDDVGGGRNIQIVRLPKFPQYVGKRMDEIARDEKMSEVDLYIKIVQDDEAGVRKLAADGGEGFLVDA